jgi:hypothetical protein
MMKAQSIWRGMALVALGLVLTGGAVQAAVPPGGNPCVVPDDGSGTVTLPPAGCGYVSPNDLHEMIKGLPPGTTIIIDVKHHKFFCRQSGSCNFPGGPLGGEVENFSSLGTLQLTGTGQLAGFSRTINIPLEVQTATSPRTVGAPVQKFTTDMRRIQGSITGDPDFALLEIVGGTDNGMASPGQTTLTLQADGTYTVESNFQVGYRIRFVGSSTGRLRGFGGTTVGSVNMGTGQADPCK